MISGSAGGQHLADIDPYRPLTAEQLEETQELALRNRAELETPCHPMVCLVGLMVANTLLWALLIEVFSLLSQLLDWIGRLVLS